VLSQQVLVQIVLPLAGMTSILAMMYPIVQEVREEDL